MVFDSLNRIAQNLGDIIRARPAQQHIDCSSVGTSCRSSKICRRSSRRVRRVTSSWSLELSSPCGSRCSMVLSDASYSAPRNLRAMSCGLDSSFANPRRSQFFITQGRNLRAQKNSVRAFPVLASLESNSPISLSSSDCLESDRALRRPWSSLRRPRHFQGRRLRTGQHGEQRSIA